MSYKNKQDFVVKSLPAPWAKVRKTELSKITGVCLDIDDTLSTQGKLTAPAFSALWKLKEAGFAVVPVTGRPAGWCDHIVRFWPVDAVVGENGAFTFFSEAGVRKRVETPCGGKSLPALSPGALKQKLGELKQKILKEFPHAKWASDQAYRENDLAIDICEDVDPWSSEKIQALLRLCEQQGAHAKLSSIHVNTWFGEYDKRKGFEYWLSLGGPGLPKKSQKNLLLQNWLYIGDSPNDEPMFAAFPHSVGVANLNRYLDRLQIYPTWITSKESGEGFAQMAKKLVEFTAL